MEHTSSAVILVMLTIFQTSDLVNHQGSEMDKIQEMISQATKEFDPST